MEEAACEQCKRLVLSPWLDTISVRNWMYAILQICALWTMTGYVACRTLAKGCILIPFYVMLCFCYPPCTIWTKVTLVYALSILSKAQAVLGRLIMLYSSFRYLNMDVMPSGCTLPINFKLVQSCSLSVHRLCPCRRCL